MADNPKACPDFAAIAALVGDRTRAAMLAALMDGTAHTATELALAGDVSPPTASSHLAKLVAGGLVAVVRQGRHRYARIASPEVAAVIEGLMGLGAEPARPLRVGPDDAGLRRARVCYDHLAGSMGVRLLERLREAGFVRGDGDALELTPAGEVWCARIGLDLAALRERRRRLCRPCLDWSERRAHLAGAVGAAILERLLKLRCARREVGGGRAVHLSPRGERFVEALDLGR